jgi:hypothetical protein
VIDYYRYVLATKNDIVHLNLFIRGIPSLADNSPECVTNFAVLISSALSGWTTASCKHVVSQNPAFAKCP